MLSHASESPKTTDVSPCRPWIVPWSRVAMIFGTSLETVDDALDAPA